MGGVDGFDWSVFGGNPTPGDPDGVRAIAARLRDLADGVAHQNGLLQSVGSASHSVWEGPAATAFRPHLDKLPGQLHKLTTSYRDAADALDGYWPRLAAAQQQAVDAWHKAQAAKGQVQTAQAQVSAAGQAASTAADTYNHAVHAASTAPPDPSGVTASHLSSLQTAYQNASNQLSGAHNALASANANLNAAHQLADSARTHAKTAAQHVAAGLHKASNAGIHNPHHSLLGSVVDDIGGAISGAVHFAEHHWEDAAAFAFAGPVGLLLTPDGRHLLHAIEPELKWASKALGWVSLGLSVLAFVPVIGEFAEVANEADIALKTGADGLLVAAGDQEALRSLAFDGVLAATGGLGRAFGTAGDAAEAGEGAEKAAEALNAGNAEVGAAGQAVRDAQAARDSAAIAEREAAMDAGNYAGVARLADATGGDSAPIWARASAAEADGQAASAAIKTADGQLAEAQNVYDAANSQIPKLTQDLTKANADAEKAAAITRTDAVIGLKPASEVSQRASLEASRLKSAGTVAGYYAEYLGSGSAQAAHIGVFTTKVVDLGVGSYDQATAK